ncbi:hypothetical protein IEO21_06612 [Rhodonia placenta]|uniref:DUF7770 domain-containing protein n=1 Tax=Rhodonia placenta TaxID=104341 RepID=A0A8H7U150_9APHY|nr:hypothetical protein IEO21_06612 [Postia placenta]
MATSQKSVELHVALIRAASGLANMIGISRSYGHTAHEFKRLELQLAKAFTVKEMIDLVITGKRRHQFMFDMSSGSGCAYWCITVIGDLEEAGMLPSGTKREAQEFRDLVAVELNNAQSMPLQMPLGTFYD